VVKPRPSCAISCERRLACDCTLARQKASRPPSGRIGSLQVAGRAKAPGGARRRRFALSEGPRRQSERTAKRRHCGRGTGSDPASLPPWVGHAPPSAPLAQGGDIAKLVIQHYDRTGLAVPRGC
jgi:hypothetical protein